MFSFFFFLAATVCVCVFYCLYCSIQIILHMYDYSANCLVDAITAATYVVLNGSMVGWTNKNPISYVCKDVGMDWNMAQNMEGQKERWVDLKMDFRWWWTEMNKVWMNENRQITGWMDGWMDGCGKEGGKGWVVWTKRPKVKRLPWGVQTALQKSSQQSSRGLASSSSSSSCLTSAGGQTQVKLLQRRKPDAVKNP